MDRKTRTGIDYSLVTPATGMSANDHPIASTLADEMPRNDMPAAEQSVRSDPDKIIPGPEAASVVDEMEEDDTVSGLGDTTGAAPRDCR